MLLLERNLGTDLDELFGEILASGMPPGRPVGEPPPGGGDTATEDEEDEAE
jgi:hypothetical protein